MKYQEEQSENAKSQITNQVNNTPFFQAEELHWNIILRISIPENAKKKVLFIF